MPNKTIIRAIAAAGAVLVVALIVTLLLVQQDDSPDPSPPASQPTTEEPTVPYALPATPPPAPYYVDPQGVFQQQLEAAAQVADTPEDAAILRRMATMSWATWWSNASDLHTEVHQLLTGAAQAGQPALVAIYRVPGRDCAEAFSAAGAATSAEAYLAELQEFVALVDSIGTDVTVVYEADAVTQFLDTNRPQCAERNPGRLELLREGVTILKSSPHIKVLFDAGNAGWLSPEVMVPGLMKAGLDLADGVAVNVSNAKWTDQSVAYGKELVAGNPGHHVLVDTGRNGVGPYTEGNPEDTWCNPPGRAFGPYPGTPYPDANDPDVDVTLAWVKIQGQSDGECADGTGLPAGTLDPSIALEYAKNAGW